MKKIALIPFIAAVALVLISWGGVGHKTVAIIAYNHLTPQAKEVVKRFLGDTTMADAASWADQVIREPQYKNTATQHYANVPLGLTYEQFQKEINTQDKDNVYKAVERNKAIFISPNSTKQQRLVALKFLIHFVGDLHQPMHISRAEDKGGNTIQLQYEGKGTNLHSLWDSKLIGTEGKNFEQMSIDYDKASTKQIKQWQSAPVIKWMWESYQISSKLYTEVEQNNKLDESYYKSHINIVNERIEVAGIRLAGLLNELAKNLLNHPPIVTELPGPKQELITVKLEDVAKYIGHRVAVQGNIADYKKFQNMVLVNLGAPYPNSSLTLVFKGDAKSLADIVINSKNQKVLVLGTLVDYQGKPQIEVTNANQLYEVK